MSCQSLTCRNVVIYFAGIDFHKILPRFPPVHRVSVNPRANGCDGPAGGGAEGVLAETAAFVSTVHWLDNLVWGMRLGTGRAGTLSAVTTFVRTGKAAVGVFACWRYGAGPTASIDSLVGREAGELLAVDLEELRALGGTPANTASTMNAISVTATVTMPGSPIAPASEQRTKGSGTRGTTRCW